MSGILGSSKLSLSGRGSQLLAQCGLWIALGILIAYFSARSPYFFTTGNFKNILLQVSITGILAVGQTFVIITGGIDLSVGSTIGLAGIVAADVMAHGGGWALGIAASLGVGAAVGLANGVFIGVFGLQPFIVTFASLYAVSGLALMQNNAQPVGITNSTFDSIGSSSIGGVPVLVIFFVAVLVVGFVFQVMTPRGRHLFALGANSQAAREYGIPVRSLTVGVYLMNGLLAGLAAALLDAWTATGEPTGGTGYELIAIAAVVIGGTSLLGGEGGVHQTIVGILMIGVISNGLNLAGVASYTQQIVTGGIIVAAVLFDRWRRRRTRLASQVVRLAAGGEPTLEEVGLNRNPPAPGRPDRESPLTMTAPGDEAL